MDEHEAHLWKVAWICLATVLITGIVGMTIDSVSGYRYGYQRVVTITHGGK